MMKGTWCPVCVAQLSRLDDLGDELLALEARALGLTTDGVPEAHQVVEQLTLPYDIVSDPTHEVVEQMGLWHPSAGHPMPSIVVYDSCGTERGRLEGRNALLRPERALLALLASIDPSTEPCLLERS